MKNSLIILSGGMNNITLLYDQKNYIALAVTFDYGSNHNKREAELAAYHCKRLDIEHLIIPLYFMGKYFKSSLLEGADAVPEGHYYGTCVERKRLSEMQASMIRPNMKNKPSLIISN